MYNADVKPTCKGNAKIPLIHGWNMLPFFRIIQIVWDNINVMARGKWNGEETLPYSTIIRNRDPWILTLLDMWSITEVWDQARTQRDKWHNHRTTSHSRPWQVAFESLDYIARTADQLHWASMPCRCRTASPLGCTSCCRIRQFQTCSWRTCDRRQYLLSVHCRRLQFGIAFHF